MANPDGKKGKKSAKAPKVDRTFILERNKRRRQERHQRRVAAALIKQRRVPRGAARSIRRALKQQAWLQRQGA